MLAPIYSALGTVMAFFNSITGSYAVALILYALVFKIVFLPFAIKQQKSQVKMAKLTPQIELIKAKYKGRTDQATMQRQQQEIMDLQQKEGYSPFSGCLPLLIQLPIIMLLYTVIQNPLSYIAKERDFLIEYNQNYTKSEEEFPTDGRLVSAYGDSIYKKDADGNFVINEETGKKIRVELDPVKALYAHFELDSKNGEIALINKIYEAQANDEEGTNVIIARFGIDEATIPNFRLFGVNLADKPSITKFSILLIIPILAALSQWISMWLMRKFNNTNVLGAEEDQTQKSMKIMDFAMPAMTLFFAFSFSGMLGLYWVYQSLLGLLQSFILARVMPLPRFTPEELREMRKKQREAERTARTAAKTTRHRSLHYIDEDDYDSLPEAPENTSGGKKGGTIGGSVPEIKD